MIARIWHGYEYRKTLMLGAMPFEFPGRGRDTVPAREHEQKLESSLPLWESLEAIRNFSGSNYEVVAFSAGGGFSSVRSLSKPPI